MLAGLTDAGNLPVLRLRGSGAAMQAVAAGEGPGGMWAAWRRMERAARLPTQAPAFAAALASTLLAGACVEVFLEEGALLALVRDPGFLARWRMVGAREVFEPGDAIAADPASLDALAHELVRDGRPVSLDRVPADSPLLAALGRALKGRGRLSVRPTVPTPTIPLDASWTTPEQHFNSGRRSDFRRAARRAADLGTVTCEVLSPLPAQFDALFDEAIGVEVASWKKDAGTAIAVDPRKEAFFRAYFRAACAEGTMRIAFLRIDGRAVAMQMGVETLGCYWLYKIGYDEAYAKSSPGTLLMLHTLAWAAERGLASYELLGDVEPWIVTFWTREQHACVRLRTYPYNLRGAWAFAADGFTWLHQRLARRAA